MGLLFNFDPHACLRDTQDNEVGRLELHVNAVLGTSYDSARKPRSKARRTVDGKILDYAGFPMFIAQPVDRMLIARHESNPRSSNYYKESYKILWKKLS
jgi:hypothetical protein